MGLRGELMVLLGLALGLCMMSVQLEAQLQVEFYRISKTRRCPDAEDIVRQEVQVAISKNAGLAAGLVRLHFHDCFVRGCDGSVLIDSTSNNTAEKDSPINNPSLRGFEVVDSAKARLERKCPGVVSCADILAFAARDSLELTARRLSYEVPSGRRDGRVSIAAETFQNLPPPTFDVSQLTQNFAAKGLTQDEMVTLSGTHTIGRSHCTSFTNRLYSFNSTVSQDPSLDPTYASQLKKNCPQSSTDTSLVVPMDPSSPNFVDSSYYSNIINRRGLFTSDQTLVSDPTTAALVRQNAARQAIFVSKLEAAMVKMGKIGVLTGSDGEIRTKCRVINS